VPSRFIRLTRIVFEAVGLDPVSEKTVHRALKHYGRE
jgi:hypothetical protein